MEEGLELVTSVEQHTALLLVGCPTLRFCRSPVSRACRIRQRGQDHRTHASPRPLEPRATVADASCWPETPRRRGAPRTASASSTEPRVWTHAGAGKPSGRVALVCARGARARHGRRGGDAPPVGVPCRLPRLVQLLPLRSATDPPPDGGDVEGQPQAEGLELRPARI